MRTAPVDRSSLVPPAGGRSFATPAAGTPKAAKPTRAPRDLGSQRQVSQSDGRPCPESDGANDV